MRNSISEAPAFSAREGAVNLRPPECVTRPNPRAWLAGQPWISAPPSLSERATWTWSALFVIVLLGILGVEPARGMGARLEAERLRRVADRAFDDGDFDRALHSYEEFLARVPSLGPTVDESTIAQAAERLGLAVRSLGHYGQARARLEAALEWTRRHAPDRTHGIELDLAETLSVTGLYAQAQRLFVSALAFAHRDDSMRARIERGLSTCAGALGHYDEQQAHALRALAAASRAHDAAAQALARTSLADERMAANDYTAARTLVGQAERDAGPNPKTPVLIPLLLTRAQVSEGLGRYQEAIAASQEALDRAEQAHLPAAAAAAQGALGEAAYLVGDEEKALLLFERSLIACSDLGALDGVALGAFRVGRLALWTRNWPKAKRNLDMALETYRRTQQPVGQAIALAGLGALAQERHDPSAALEMHTRALALFRQSGEKNGVSTELVGVARALVDQGESDKAMRALDEARHVAADPDLEWRAQYVRALAYRHAHELSLARTALESSVAALESMRQTITLRMLKGSFGSSQERARVYEELLLLLLDQGRPEDAFAVAERFRARVFQEMLAARAAGSPLPVAAASSQTANAVTSNAVVGGASVATLGAIQRALGPDTALVEYFVGEDTLVTFIVDPSHLIARRQAIGEGMLRQRVQLLRLLMRTLRAWEPVARSLDDILLAPVRTATSLHRLVVVPHDVLHYLPFAALIDPSGTPTMRRVILDTVPAAGLLVQQSGRPRGRAGRVLAMGNPDLGDPALDLPHAAEEVDGLRGNGVGTRVLLRKDATRDAFLALAPHASLIHIAAHAILDVAHPLASAILLAPGRTAGAVTVAEILQMKLAADLVVLSACDSGRGQLLRGDELVGLTRAFLEAGSGGLVASLWPVADVATSELMRRFYAHRAECDGDSARALALAQRDLQSTRRFHDPLYWAAFTYCGGQ